MDYFWILVIFLSAICTVTVNFSKSVLMKKNLIYILNGLRVSKLKYLAELFL